MSAKLSSQGHAVPSLQALLFQQRFERGQEFSGSELCTVRQTIASSISAYPCTRTLRKPIALRRSGIRAASAGSRLDSWFQRFPHDLETVARRQSAEEDLPRTLPSSCRGRNSALPAQPHRHPRYMLLDLGEAATRVRPLGIEQLAILLYRCNDIRIFVAQTPLRYRLDDGKTASSSSLKSRYEIIVGVFLELHKNIHIAASRIKILARGRAKHLQAADAEAPAQDRHLLTLCRYDSLHPTRPVSRPAGRDVILAYPDVRSDIDPTCRGSQQFLPPRRLTRYAPARHGRRD